MPATPTRPPACSAGRRGTTRRCSGHRRHAFVYFTYGHHWMLCVVTREDVPEVVLLRAGEVVAGLPVALLDRRRPDRVGLSPGRGAATAVTPGMRDRGHLGGTVAAAYGRL